MKILISTTVFLFCLVSIVGAQTPTQEMQRLAGIIDIAPDRQVNLRAAPTANSESLLKLNLDQKVSIRGKSVFNGETEWVPVQIGDCQGWVTRKFLRVTSIETPTRQSPNEQVQSHVTPTEQPPLASQATPSSSDTSGGGISISPSGTVRVAAGAQDLEKRYRVTGIVDGDFLNVRAGPGGNYRIVTQMYDGCGGIQIVGVPVMNGADNWIHILSQDLEGWTRPKYLVAEELSTSDKINFQRAAAGNNVSMAARYISPEYINEPYVAYPENPADVGHPYPPVLPAALRGQTRLLILLAEHGADMTYRLNGRPLAFFAAKRGHYDTAELAKKYGGGTTADITDGKALYALEHTNPNVLALGVTLFLTAAALDALSNGSSGSTDSDHDRAVQANSMHEANQDAINRGFQKSFPGY